MTILHVSGQTFTLFAHQSFTMSRRATGRSMITEAWRGKKREKTRMKLWWCFRVKLLPSTHLKASVRVGAELWACSGNFTLVDIVACPIVFKLESLLAVTVEARWRVDADVTAAAVIRFAFVTSTLVNRLVFCRWAILLFIAHLWEWNACAVAAVKFSFDITLWLYGCCALRKKEREWKCEKWKYDLRAVDDHIYMRIDLTHTTLFSSKNWNELFA